MSRFTPVLFWIAPLHGTPMLANPPWSLGCPGLTLMPPTLPVGEVDGKA
jgi:hypothetical protein